MAAFKVLLNQVDARIRPMVLIASLPKNDPELALAALEGGADVVKFHLNVHHHASDTHFGTLEQERSAIEKILEIWKGKPAGVVPGGSAEIDAETLSALPGLGVCFLSLYLRHARVGALPAMQQVDRMLAVSYQDSCEIIGALDRLPIQVCEMSIMHPNSYGQPFTYHDLACYAAISERTHLPLVVPTQHRITPQAVEDLLWVGVSAVMIGAVVSGNTPEQWREVTKSFRKEMDAVWR
ncbi:MAG: hypothetical protein PHQ40_01930 [Anaerolineaceae bacterium]|nr:hypothetical protein [Anaerolineaceae bacterium]